MESNTNSRIKSLVNLILQSYKDVEETIKIDSIYQLNRSVIIDVMGKLRRLIFPGYFVRKYITAGLIEYHTGELIEDIFFDLTKQIAVALRHRPDGSNFSESEIKELSENIVCLILEAIPQIRKIIATDVDATFKGDPAAYSKDEIISSYPGIYAIMAYRLAHELYKLDIPLIPRVMSEHAHSTTGIDIHPGATIGSNFFIDHGTGIVIGETTIIGNYVKIYQGVTLGGLSTSGGQTLKNVKRHPTIEDNVTIYSGASILGGNTVIGEGVVIGSNAFVTKSVPKRTRVSVRNPELQIKDRQTERTEFEQDEFWFYAI